MDNEKRLSRNYSLDLIRIFALFSVISIHFFKYIGYYEVTLEGTRLLLITIARNFFTVCVPLFLVLTGYLQNQKKLCKKYYIGIKKILVTYFLAGMCCAVFSYLSGESYTLQGIIGDVLNYTMAPYGWYVEMYIGLFLMIPFLNLVWNNLNYQKQKQWLIVTMLLLTTLPTVLNIYNFKETGWWSMPSKSADYFKILPFWWGGCWPVTYYFTGCYIKEYGVKITRSLNMFLIFFVTVAIGLFNFWFSNHHYFVQGNWNSWGSFPVFVLTVLVFVFLLGINLENSSPRIKSILRKLSELSFGAYLLSYIFDEIFYDLLNFYIEEVTDRVLYCFIIVSLIFIYSMALSYIINIIGKRLIAQKK